MIVTILSECTGRSRERSQRIIDKYLHRVGRRSWMGSITEQGLGRLRSEIKQSASRTTAVICHRTTARSRTVIEWKIGRKDAFDVVGRVPVSVSHVKTLRGDTSKPAAYRIFVATVGLSALLHDLGKASFPFHQKIQSRRSTSDPVRHELVSYALVTQTLFEIGLKEDCSAREFIAALGSSAFVDKLDEILKNPKGVYSSKLEKIVTAKLRTRTFGRFAEVVMALVATHHKLIRGRGGDQGSEYIALSHVNDVENVKKSFKFVSGGLKAFGAAEDISKWKLRLARTSKEIAAALGDLPGVDGQAATPFLRSMFIAGRTALVAGDQHSSAQGSHHSRSTLYREGFVYANTVNDSHVQLPDNCAAQTLARHLLSVEAASRVAAHALMKLHGRMPCLEHDDLPADIAFPQYSDDRFAWQRDGARMLSAHRGEEDRGLLALVMAATGTGKTRAIPTLLAACGPLRYSAALGLRTLTLQTGREYIRKLGFGQDQVAIAIGSTLVEKLDRLRQDEVSPLESDEASRAQNDPRIREIEQGFDNLVPSVAFGSDSVPEDPVGMVLGDIPTLDIPNIFHRWNTPAAERGLQRNRKALDFIAAPIMSCTIDMLMPPVNGFRNSFVSQAVRVSTADLVIDEIDDFSARDVAAILRLVELSAANGRKVVVSSATLPHEVAAAVHAAYLSGRKMYAALHGGTEEYDVAWFSNEQGCSAIETSPEDFEGSHRRFAANVINALSGRHSGRRVRIHPVKAETVGDYYQEMADQIPVLHALHGNCDPKTGRKVSSGVVRFNNVRRAIEFSRYMSKVDVPYDLVMVCYVGTLQPSIRHFTEQRLDSILNRKPVGDLDPLFFDNSYLRGSIDDAQSRDVVFLVVTTSMEETGRDHDFDFMILEPAGLRSLIQMGGRLRRHRSALPSDAPENIVLMDRCIRDVAGETTHGAYAFPGFQTPQIRGDKPPKTDSNRATDLFAGEDIDQQVNAVGILADPKSPIGTHERNNWFRILRDPEDNIATGVATLRPVSVISDASDAARRVRAFRDNMLQGEMTLYQDENRDTFIQARKGADQRITIDSIPLNTNRFLLRDVGDAVSAALELTELLPGADISLLTEYTVNVRSLKDSSIRHHPILGAYVG